VAALNVAEGVTNPAAVEKILKSSARKPHKQTYEENRYGAGIIDADAAIKAVRGKSGLWQLGLAALLGLATVFSLRGRGIAIVRLGAGFGGGLLAGAAGLFFLPLLGFGLESCCGLEFLTRGLPSWGMAFGPIGANVLFLSAIVPAGLLILGWGSVRARTVLAGLVLGVAGHLLFLAASAQVDVTWMVADTAWLMANAAVCVLLARQALKQ
jgi:hypothetical protein